MPAIVGWKAAFSLAGGHCPSSAVGDTREVLWVYLAQLRRRDSELVDLVDDLRADTRRRQAGPARYGTAAGTSPFSWTAALTLILLEEERRAAAP